jgi:hypothetical protein
MRRFVRNRVELTDVDSEDGAGTIGRHTLLNPERGVLGFPGKVCVVSQVCWHICYVRRQLPDTVLNADRRPPEDVDSGQSSCFGHVRIAAMHDGVGIGVLGCHFVYSSCRTNCLPASVALFHCPWFADENRVCQEEVIGESRVMRL